MTVAPRTPFRENSFFTKLNESIASAETNLEAARTRRTQFTGITSAPDLIAFLLHEKSCGDHREGTVPAYCDWDTTDATSDASRHFEAKAYELLELVPDVGALALVLDSIKVYVAAPCERQHADGGETLTFATDTAPMRR